MKTNSKIPDLLKSIKRNQNPNKCIINPESNFKHIRKLSRKITKIIKKYDIHSLTKAIFCFNAWRSNRSFLSASMALNLSLSSLQTTGKISINTYDELKSFYEEISDFIIKDIMDDPIIDDFGEVFINHENICYPVITGTGHTQVYSALRYLVTLSNLTNKSHELSALLQYQATIINTLKETNCSPHSEIMIFELPSIKFWDSINILFSSPAFTKLLNTVPTILPTTNLPIEQTHFFKYNDQIFPLFNTSILVDYYKLLLTTASNKDIDAHITKTIQSLLETIFNFSPKTPNLILINPYIFANKDFNNILSKDLIFAGLYKNELLIAIKNNGETTLELINIINKLKDSNSLTLLEPFYRNYTKGNLALDVNSSFNVTYMIVDYHTDITTDIFMLAETDQQFTCTALDAVYLIGFTPDIKEIIDFIHHYKNDNTKYINFGGISSHYFAWKESNRNISSGAIEYDQVLIDFNHTEVYTYHYFANNLDIFPRTGKGLFEEPLSWIPNRENNEYINILHKGCYGFGGNIMPINEKTYLFLAHNVELYTGLDFNNTTSTAYALVEELNLKLFKKYSYLMAKFEILNDKYLELLFIPYSYAQRKFSDMLLSTSNTSLVFSQEYISSDSIILRFSVNPEFILSRIQEATDCSVENLFFKELLAPLQKYEPKAFKELSEKLFKDSNDKKSVNVLVAPLEYYFNEKTTGTLIKEISYVRTQKEIATICMNANISPGKYTGKKATCVIRAMQESAVTLFESCISNFDKLHLHKKILNYYAIQEHNIYLNYLRYNSNSNLSQDIEIENKAQTIKIREEYRRHSMTAQYLLESNLFIEHIDSKICDNDSFEFLLAFSDWLVMLQYNADNCNHTEYDFVLEVDSEYKINFIINETAKNTYDMLVSRKYTVHSYHVKNDDIDKSFFDNALEAFKRDTSFDITVFLEILKYLKLNLYYDNIANEIYPNVFEIDRTVLIQNLQQIFINPYLNYSDLNKILDFMTLNTSLLKSIDNNHYNILPIWERKSRDNRASTKPLILHNGNYVFSPSIVHYVYESWKNGILDWYLPYTIGLDNLCKELKAWKKRYEDEMVDDICNLFHNAKFDNVIPNFELHKRFPQCNYPDNLGDYDVFAISKTNKEIWIIESKVLQKVGSVYEDQMQQKNFFIQGKYDVKFQKRIDYAMTNISKILTSLNLPLDNYQIIPYMVTNKLFASRYKEINFPIITFSELQEKLSTI